jgi:hypothetical protein
MIKQNSILIILSFFIFTISCASPKYILNDSVINKKTSTEMTVLILNQDNTINSTMSQKVTTVFSNNKGYVTSTSVLTNKFVTEGYFEKLYNGEKFNISKLKINKYVDFLCLGKLTTDINKSTIGENMIQAILTLEIRIINTKNGASVNSFSKYKSGIGFSKQQAVEVATDNIINDLK